MKRFLSIEELREKAQSSVPKMFFDYCESGSWDEESLNINISDLKNIQFKPRVVRNLSNRKTKINLLGEEFGMPIGLSPCGLTGMQHADGEIHAAKAAEKFEIPFTLSTMSIVSIEDLAKNVSREFWFQLYVMKDRKLTNDLMTRAKAVGCNTLVLTVDLQVLGIRYKDVKNGLSTPPKLTLKTLLDLALKPKWAFQIAKTKNKTFGNLKPYITNVSNLNSLSSWINDQFDESLSWDDIKKFRDLWPGKLIIKGIMAPEDAEKATSMGADALIISNHGGRQLDGCASSVSALIEIKKTLSSKPVSLLFDGGIRNGKDILKVRALGATMGMIGRPYLYGLGAGGESGVIRALEILHEQLDRTMALCGHRDINSVDQSILK
ncbi:MAG: alpha-hydroxy-acid oxidizing enzyme [Verrucomicrobiales bacterium]|nr:alpha-hydroxy-acid oxidizing enzyme [Verrucomicrobiales bacterium]